MIIGISGSQGQGKTTLVKELSKHNISSIQINLARSIMYDMDLSLDEINSNLDKKVKFQEKLLEKLKSSYTEEHILSEDKFAMDRTYLDLFVYTLIGLGQYNKYNQFINEYYDKCKEYSNDIIATYILSGREELVENDSVRGYNIHYSVMVNNLIIKFAEKIIENFYSILYLNNLNEKAKVITSYMDLFNEK